MGSKKYLLGACAAAVIGLVSGCGGDVEGTAAPKSSAPAAGAPASTAASDQAAPSEHNADDVKFAQRLLPHHEQAVVISRLAFERSADPEVTALARRIHDARGPEMKQLMALLQGWGEPVAPPDHGDSIGHGDFGLLSEEELQGLEQASGAEFDREWLRLMTEHHEGAVEIAELELRDGVDSLAKLFAQNAVDGQTAELAELRSLAAG